MSEKDKRPTREGNIKEGNYNPPPRDEVRPPKPPTPPPPSKKEK